ncbi:putative phosphatidylinositolglycan class N [Piedraia hortae CBS 480.64]|uniref:GPI ethanolamine phosphate transferase 1 n=1 Tax=Piedraia hortae CBS 480.64 TaxID=1314780 RepID=A0A6A7CCB3_9PEZI|nr:putative phosphatidylinositolglycan class N [Piedraia hortae CBS 480.64]
MARLGRRGFLAMAVVFHLVYILSIFDTYFRSPIVRGMQAYRVESPQAPAKRLVLYVGDGLRADKAFQYFPDPSGNDTEPHPLAPFLRSRVLEHGTFGVSHTRVPTESRPGHVALIAGLYEDVSSVTTGWKLNPVNFDSVFNRSTHTWSWGSPDILPMFSTGASPGKVTDSTYGAEFEDFSKDATELDHWVFDRVKLLFQKAKIDPELNEELHRDGNVFFLHLLGLDTTGHSYRPYSREYLRNIQVVDEGVREITQTIDDFFGDGQTAYVFTADHGMSDWGSHGDGHPDNTRTPLIAWGAGVAKPVTVSESQFAPGHEDGFSHDWHLDHVKRNDVAQADIATLMAYLAHLEFPVNSVGELPLPYLDASDEEKAKAMMVNARQIVEMYRVKEEQKKARVVNYRPFSPEEPIKKKLSSVEALLTASQYDNAIKAADEVIKHTLKGLRYLQTYDWVFLRTVVTLGYLGWIAFAFTTAVDEYMLGGRVQVSRTPTLIGAFAAILVGVYSMLLYQDSPLTYYAYVFFPVFFWEEVFARRKAWVAAKDVLLARQDAVKLALDAGLYLAILEVMVQSYYRRQIYTVCYLLAVVWPLFHGWSFVQQNKILCLTWALGCSSMSIFTLLPAVKVETPNLITLGGVLILFIGILYLAFEQKLTNQRINPINRTITGIQVGLIALAILVTHSSVTSLQSRQGLPLGTQLVGWITLILSLLIPFLHALHPQTHYLPRLAVLFLSFGPLFIILTISYEGLFYLSIAITLITWVNLEHKLQNQSPSSPPTRPLTLSDARISLFFLYLLQSAFFSTGNIASISSFSLDAVYRLLPVFDPFSQGALLLLKLLAPFALVSANLGILTKRLRLQGGSLFAVVLGISDYLTLRFFWLVRDEGSWLEIGESISMFVIASVLCGFVAALEGLSGLLVGGVVV